MVEVAVFREDWSKRPLMILKLQIALMWVMLEDFYLHIFDDLIRILIGTIPKALLFFWLPRSLKQVCANIN